MLHSISQPNVVHTASSTYSDLSHAPKMHCLANAALKDKPPDGTPALVDITGFSLPSSSASSDLSHLQQQTATSMSSMTNPPNQPRGQPLAAPFVLSHHEDVPYTITWSSEQASEPSPSGEEMPHARLQDVPKQWMLRRQHFVLLSHEQNPPGTSSTITSNLDGSQRRFRGNVESFISPPQKRHMSRIRNPYVWVRDPLPRRHTPYTATARPIRSMRVPLIDDNITVDQYGSQTATSGAAEPSTLERTFGTTTDGRRSKSGPSTTTTTGFTSTSQTLQPTIAGGKENPNKNDGM